MIIKKGAQIGTHSIIMPGVTIAEGAIVGAHSFVKEDVHPASLSSVSRHGEQTAPLRDGVPGLQPPKIGRFFSVA